MVQTSARLLALLSLLQQRREWTGPELAGRLEVGPRTIRRDVEKLRELGYPIEAAPGVAGGYRLGAGTDMPPLLLDDAEAVAVAVGLRSAASGSIAGIEETSVRALAKLEQILPSRLRRRVRDLGDATSAFSVEGPRIDADQLSLIAGACRDGTRLRFDYTAKDDTATIREVEPAAIVHSGWRWYLVAFDLDRDDWRTFRVDRIAGRRRARRPRAAPRGARRRRGRLRQAADPRPGGVGRRPRPHPPRRAREPDRRACARPLRDGRARRAERVHRHDEGALVAGVPGLDGADGRRDDRARAARAGRRGTDHRQPAEAGRGLNIR